MSIGLFNIIIYCWIALALLLFPVQLFVTAPYGRHTHNKWGATIDNRLGWMLMEIVSPICFAWFFLSGTNELSFPMWIFFMLWMGHYINRSIIFPMRTNTSGKKIPVLIIITAVLFNVFNGWSNGYYLGSLGPEYSFHWFYSPQFIIGIIIFFIGMYINISSDNHLIGLRSNNDQGYSIPRGRFFHKISCPNLFGEILEWAGFAILSWNIAAFGFAIWTAANLIPRAISHHRWYRSHFKDYPADRKAVIPYLI